MIWDQLTMKAGFRLHIMDQGLQLGWAGRSQSHTPTVSAPQSRLLTRFLCHQVLYQTVTGLKKDLSGVQKVGWYPCPGRNGSKYLM